MNWRALGCGLLAAAVFVLIGVFGIWRALAPAGCPPEFPTQAGVWQPVGEVTADPRLPGSDEALEPSGEVGFGLATWELWVPARTAPGASGQTLPERLVLRCDEDTYQAYEHTGP